ncbi:ABC transporter permease [Clostridiaceae bacterium M8S5]|nr:ABC transporter permease [Clostridiaceae bacterium M8S5]
MLNILIKELKQGFRNRSSMALMILFPIVLIWILGTAFNNQFASSSLDYDGATVIYSYSEEGPLSSSFENFIESIKKSNIEFIKIEKDKYSPDMLKGNSYACYISINEKEGKITVLKNQKIQVVSDFIENTISAFVQKYNFYYEVSKVNSSALETILNKKSPSNINTSMVSVAGDRKPRSIDYFSITMLTLIIMYTSSVSFASVKDEDILKTGDRIHVSPINMYSLFFGKVFGNILLSILRVAVVILFSMFVYKVYWGNNILILLTIIFSQLLMCISVGIGVGYSTKDQSAGNSILNILIPIFVFLGGGYFPLEQFGNNILVKISVISPIKWINETMFDVIYLNDFKNVSFVIMLNLSISFMFSLLSLYKFKRKGVV